MDSVGIGELPDADAYGDRGSNTLGNIARRVPLRVPTLRALGLDRLVALGGTPPDDRPRAAIGRMAEASAGKDSVTGHWEMMGIVLDRPFPDVPRGLFRGHHRGVLASRQDARSSATRQPPAPRSSTNSAPSTCGQVPSSSTRRPTACFKSPPTKTSCLSRSSTRPVRSHTSSWARGLASDVSSRVRLSAPPDSSNGRPTATTTRCRRRTTPCSID